MNSSIKLIAYVKVYATFNTFVGLDPIQVKRTFYLEKVKSGHNGITIERN